MKRILSIVLVVAFVCFLIGDVWAKGSSSSGGSRSFSSSSSSSFSSKSFSSSSLSSSSKSFSSSSNTKPMSSGSLTPSTSATPKTFKYSTSTPSSTSSKSSWFKNTTPTTVYKPIIVRPRTVIPPSYGTYSSYYYSRPYVNTDHLMYYMILDTLSDAAVMTAISHQGAQFDSWKASALASDNVEMKAKVLELEKRMAALNSTGNVTAGYVDPEIETKMKAGIDETEVVGGNEEQESSGWSTFFTCTVGAIILGFLAVMLFPSRKRKY